MHTLVSVLLCSLFVQSMLPKDIEKQIREKALLTLHFNARNAFFTSENPKNIMHGHVKMYAMR